MDKRTLTITLQSDWQKALRLAGTTAWHDTYRGETLNFESPGILFSQLTGERWAIINFMQKTDALKISELAQQIKRDRKTVEKDVQALLDLGLLECTDNGKVLCPYADIHVDMHIVSERQAA